MRRIRTVLWCNIGRYGIAWVVRTVQVYNGYRILPHKGALLVIRAPPIVKGIPKNYQI